MIGKARLNKIEVVDARYLSNYKVDWKMFFNAKQCFKLELKNVIITLYKNQIVFFHNIPFNSNLSNYTSILNIAT